MGDDLLWENTTDANKPLLDPIIEGNTKTTFKVREQDIPKPWVDIISGNRLTANGVEIEYATTLIVNGKIEVLNEEQDVSSEKELWANTLIMYMLGGDLSMNVVTRFMMNVWNIQYTRSICYYMNGQIQYTRSLCYNMNGQMSSL